jgi:hypothetical protein
MPKVVNLGLREEGSPRIIGVFMRESEKSIITLHANVERICRGVWREVAFL